MRVATKFGFDLEVFPKSYFAKHLQINECWEEPESRLILSLVSHGDFCIDAGAYVGYFACLMRQAGARVLAIEPNPHTYKTLVRNLPAVMACDYALSDVTDLEPVPFYLSSEFDDGWSSLATAVDGDRTNRIGVFRIRLDDLLNAYHQSGPIRFIKLDVEGAEMPALRGLESRLQDVDYLLIECIDLPYRVAVLDSTTEQINRFLSGWTIFDWLNGKWEKTQAAYSNLESTKNFLFQNPRLKELGDR